MAIIVLSIIFLVVLFGFCKIHKNWGPVHSKEVNNILDDNDTYLLFPWMEKDE